MGPFQSSCGTEGVAGATLTLTEEVGGWGGGGGGGGGARVEEIKRAGK